jgi:hypothetical protein
MTESDSPRADAFFVPRELAAEKEEARRIIREFELEPSWNKLSSATKPRKPAA